MNQIAGLSKLATLDDAQPPCLEKRTNILVPHVLIVAVDLVTPIRYLLVLLVAIPEACSHLS